MDTRPNNQKPPFPEYHLFKGPGFHLSDLVMRMAQGGNLDEHLPPRQPEDNVIDTAGPSHVGPTDLEPPQPTPRLNPVFTLPPNRKKYWGIDFHNQFFYVMDKWNNKGLILDTTTGSIVKEFGTSTTGDAEDGSLLRPCGVVVDSRRNRVMVVDKDNFRVSIFTIDGEYIDSFGTRGHGPGQFEGSWDIDVSPLGDTLAVTDAGNHRLQIFDVQGRYLGQFPIIESDDYPRGVTYDSQGQRILVSELKKQNVLGVDVHSLGGRLLLPPDTVRRPQGITRDDYGNILLADSGNNCVRRMDTNGQILSTIGHVGSTPVDLCSLSNGMGQVAVLTSAGNIYIVSELQ